VLVGVLAVLTGAYLAAVFLGGDAQRAEQPDLVKAFRKRALISGTLTGAGALGGLLVLREDARALFDGLTSGLGLVAVIGSAVAGGLTMALVARERFGAARITASAAVAALTVGWALAQRPYVLPPRVTLEQAAASEATLVSVVIAVGIGSIILIPSLWFLYRLVLRGRLDQGFEPLDQRFRPITSSDEGRHR
jgi:cytochrome d ubiquinol oxidase subunit II